MEVKYSCQFDHHPNQRTTIKPKNNIFTYKINNFSPDKSRQIAEVTIDLALEFWEEIIGIPFVYLDSEDADLEFNFSSAGAPLPFDRDIISYLFQSSKSEFWIRDDIDWSDNEDSLYRVLVHDISQCLLEEPSSDPECITHDEISDNEVKVTFEALKILESQYQQD